MYNEEQKYMFLNTIESESSKKSIRSMFDRFEEYEDKCHQDIADWTEDQIYKMIENIYTFDFGTIKQYLSTLTLYRTYIRSAKGSEHPTVSSSLHPLDAAHIDITPAIREVFIQTPDILHNEITKVLDPSQGYYICAAACFAWLGINTQMMPYIRDSAVDFKHRSIVDNECEIEIYDIDPAIMDILRQYWDTREAIRWHHAPCKVYPYYNGKFLHTMQGINSRKERSPLKYTSIRNDFAKMAKSAKICEDVPSRLEYPNILRSGGMYRLYHLEKTGVDISLGKNDELLLRTYSAPGKTFDIRSLYRQYKKAFNLE